VISGSNRVRTPSQTVGPFFGMALPWPAGPLVVPPGTPGAIWIRGQVLDGTGAPVPDALVETWQAGPDGKLPSAEASRAPAFRGFGRSATDPGGQFEILTLRPGPVETADGLPQAPYISVAVFARGLLKQLVTRIYFPESPDNERDALLSALPARARTTLLARPTVDGYRFDIRLQGADETAFFEL